MNAASSRSGPAGFPFPSWLGRPGAAISVRIGCTIRDLLSMPLLTSSFLSATLTHTCEG
jgi:hypothetical protein